MIEIVATMHDEGYIKFQVHWENGDPDVEIPERLMQCRDHLYAVRLIGMLPDGIGYGNISMRIPGADAFIISGTQTGRFAQIQTAHFCRVTQVDIARNALWCKGYVQASSESMTHAAIYQANANVQIVIHVHHAAWWTSILHVVPTTAADVRYGTPDMALAVAALIGKDDPSGIIAAAGHQDGIFIYGNSVEAAMKIVFDHAHNWSTNNG